MTIRAIRQEDRTDVQGILVSGGFSDEEVRVGLEIFEAAAAGDYSAFVALIDEVARGYFCAAPISLTVSTWHLYWIGVHADFQRRGLGRALLAHGEAYIQSAGGERITLETSGRADYAGARLFYEDAGYAPAGRIRDFYSPGDDCVIMCKELR
jgi:ribosomal protein S18 acetylase RimI-like enzyme